MGINIGANTKKLYLGSEIVITNDQYDNGFSQSGTWSGGQIIYNGSTIDLTEDYYLDLGIVTEEREELTNGGIAISAPTRGVDDRIFWGIGGKILRLTISGIIPDGLYIDINGGALNGKSNASVFKYKLNKYISYLAFNLTSQKFPNVVQYRRTYLIERNDITSTTTTHLARYMLTGYNTSFINGTRNLAYTITLDLSNNIGLALGDNIYFKDFGDL